MVEIITPKIFVIIVTYKGHRWYERCFNSLRASTMPIEIIVVDNASNDGTVEYIRDNYTEIHLIVSPENIGFGRANNLGMRYALDYGCDYVFLLNQDTWIKPNSIEQLITCALKYPEYAILSPMHITADEKALYIQIEDGSTNHVNSLLSDCYFQSFQEVYTFKYINAAAWLMTRKTLETIGGFDPIFFLYGEDDNYLQRLDFHGMKLGLVPNSQIIHDHGKSENNYTSEYKEYRANQSKLVIYTNILVRFSVRQRIMYAYRKIIINLLRFKWKGIVGFVEEIALLRKYKVQINTSRIINKNQGSLWL